MSEEKSDEGLAVPREQHRHGQTVDDVLLDEILSSVKLPGGRRVPNRLVKVCIPYSPSNGPGDELYPGSDV